MVTNYFNRKFSGESQQKYIDDWFVNIRKPLSFYEEHAAVGLKRKSYFYSIDLQGRVFLEEVLPKNVATSLKNPNFLDTLFRQLRIVTSDEKQMLAQFGAELDYPFVSPCGLEKNFIRPADCPIVFIDLKDKEDQSTEKELCFAGTLVQPFSPAMLAISKHTGRLYHRLNHDNRIKAPTRIHKATNGAHDFGLVKSSLAVSIAENFVEKSLILTSDKTESSLSDIWYDCPQSGQMYPIPWLPAQAEPGLWSFPYSDDGMLLHRE